MRPEKQHRIKKTGFRSKFLYSRRKARKINLNLIKQSLDEWVDGDNCSCEISSTIKKSEYTEWNDNVVGGSIWTQKHHIDLYHNINKFINKHIGASFDEVFHKFCKKYKFDNPNDLRRYWYDAFVEYSDWGLFYIDDKGNIQQTDNTKYKYAVENMTQEQIDNNKQLAEAFYKKITELGTWFERPTMDSQLVPSRSYTFLNGVYGQIYNIRQNVSYYNELMFSHILKVIVPNEYYIGKMWVYDDDKTLKLKQVYAKISNNHEERRSHIDYSEMRPLHYKVPHLFVAFNCYETLNILIKSTGEFEKRIVNLCGKFDILVKD